MTGSVLTPAVVSDMAPIGRRCPRNRYRASASESRCSCAWSVTEMATSFWRCAPLPGAMDRLDGTHPC